MVLACFFDDEVEIDNHAVNGRSSKSFIDEGRWQKVIDNVKPGDYVFIQFGHNDEKPQPEIQTLALRLTQTCDALWKKPANVEVYRCCSML